MSEGNLEQTKQQLGEIEADLENDKAELKDLEWFIKNSSRDFESIKSIYKPDESKYIESKNDLDIKMTIKKELEERIADKESKIAELKK
jgi:hypothetical protein